MRSAPKGSLRVDRVLLDTSTFFDVGKAPRQAKALWAQNTIYHLVQYQLHHSKLTISAFTAFEYLNGLHRQSRLPEAEEFLSTVLPSLDVIYPDSAIYALASKIHAALALAGMTIGVPDTFIAATAVNQNLTLVTANTKHFQRVGDVGFPLWLDNWRDA